MVKVSVFLFILVASVTVVNSASQQHNATAPAPSVDCSSLIFDLTDCLSFVSSGSTDAKPEGSCCSGLKNVLNTDAECVCEAFKASASFGIELNVTKALTLPAACGISSPPSSNCELSLTPGAAPANPPKAPTPPKKAPSPPEPSESPAPVPPEPSKSPAPVPPSIVETPPASAPGSSEKAPAPAPTSSGASASVLISFAALTFGLIVVSCSYF